MRALSPKTYRVGMMWLTLTYLMNGFSFVRFLILSLLIFFVTFFSYFGRMKQEKQGRALHTHPLAYATEPACRIQQCTIWSERKYRKLPRNVGCGDRGSDGKPTAYCQCLLLHLQDGVIHPSVTWGGGFHGYLSKMKGTARENFNAHDIKSKVAWNIGILEHLGDCQRSRTCVPYLRIYWYLSYVYAMCR